MGGGEAGTNYWRPTILHMFLSFSVVSLFVDLQVDPFRTSPGHSATESQSLRFSVNIFLAGRPYVGGEGRGPIFFPTGARTSFRRPCSSMLENKEGRKEREEERRRGKSARRDCVGD